MNKLIDHTVLKAFATTEDIKQLCNEAIENNFKSVCVNPIHVKLANNLLNDSEVLVCTVIGFPLGANSSNTKSFETKQAIEDGADEIDMVINIGAVKDNNYILVEDDISAVVDAANGKTVKVIIETCYLTDDEKVKVCKVASKVGANFVKTSTGFGTGGATIKDVELMKLSISEGVLIKASGGIRNKEDLELMTKAGASRIGTSGGVKILNNKTNDKY